jgi:hypothetical protein
MTIWVPWTAAEGDLPGVMMALLRGLRVEEVCRRSRRGMEVWIFRVWEAGMIRTRVGMGMEVGMEVGIRLGSIGLRVAESEEGRAAIRC